MSGRLTGARIGVLMESDFYEPEISIWKMDEAKPVKAVA